MSGVMVQWLLDPEHAPSSHDLAEALRVISKSIQAAEPGSGNEGH